MPYSRQIVDHTLEEVEVDALGRRVAGEVQHQHLGPRPGFLRRVLELAEEVDARREWHVAHVGPGDDEAVGVDRVGRVGDQDRVSRTRRREREMGQALLRPDREDRLGLGVEVDVEPVLVPSADRPPQPRYALRHRVAVGILALRDLHQLVDDVLRGRLVGVAHAEIDDVLAARSGRRLELVDDREHVGRQPLDAAELFHLRGRHGKTSTGCTGYDQVRQATRAPSLRQFGAWGPALVAGGGGLHTGRP